MQEDIYETSDLPESDQVVKKEETFDSEHIEKIKLNVSSAYEAFKGRHLDADGVDFSDSAGPQWRRGYGAGRFVVELADKNASEPETPLQQFNRLQHEILELSEKVRDVRQKAESDATSERAAGDLTVNDVTRLQQQLKQLQIEQIIGQKASMNLADPHAAVAKNVAEALARTKPTAKDSASGKGGKKEAVGQQGHVTYELFANPDQSQNSQQTKAVELDARLAKLEQALGADPVKLGALTSGSQGKSIMDAVEGLEQRLQYLDMNHLELVEARLGVLAQKLAQVSEKKPVLEAEQVAKVNELYDMLKRWDGYCASLPQLVQRMQALKDIHEQALQFSQSLTHLDGVQQEIAKTLDSDAALLNEVKATLQQNLETIRANCDNIEKRLKSLAK